MAKLIVGTPIRKPRNVRDEEAHGEPINYQPGQEVNTSDLGLTSAEVAQYVREGVLVEPAVVKPPAKAKATREPAVGGK